MINYLKNKNAYKIDQIELVTNPNASYDASFQGRVINIKTKKREGDGEEFSLYTKATRNSDYYSPDINFDFHINRNKLSAYTDIGYYQSNRIA